MADTIGQMLVSGYDRYYRFALSIVRNKDDALDVIQEAAYKAIRNRRSLRDGEHFDAWIHKIVYNEAMDVLKKNQKWDLADDIDDAGADGFASEDRGYESVEIGSWLDMLSPEERGLVTMKYFEEMTLEEIAMVTETNLSTVKSRLYRALKKLKIAF